jgi:hypothetical protein
MRHSYLLETGTDTMTTPGPERGWVLAALRALVLSVLRVLAFASVASAQSLTSGALRVRVTDEAGQPLQGSEVRLSEAATGVARSLRVESRGEFSAQLLPAGEYEILIELLGYRPQRWTGVVVAAGRAIDINARLVAVRPPVLEIETVPFAAAAAQGTSVGVRQFLPARLLNDLPGERRELTEIARLSSVMDPERSSEGLPFSWTGMLIDGVPAVRNVSTNAARDPFRAAAFPLSAFAFAEIVRNDADVELASFPGPLLSAQTRTGSQRLSARSFGTLGSSVLSSSGGFDGGVPSYASGNGGIVISGPILRDTAHFVIGIEAQRLERPLPRLWELDDTLDARLLTIARQTYALDLQSYTQPRVLRTDVVSGFARLDWQLATGHRLDVRASGASLPRILAPTTTTATIPEVVLKGSDLSAAATLTSELSSRFGHELRVAVEHSVRDGDVSAIAESADAVVNASAHIVQGALDFGGNPSPIGRFDRSTVSAAQTLHISARTNRAKLGISAALTSYDDAYALNPAGEVFFGGLDQFSRAEGLVVAPGGTLRVATFNLLDAGAYVQDTWTPAAGLSVLAGVRYDVTSLPSKNLTLNQRWLQLTGLSNTQLPDTRHGLSPRFALQWDMGARQQSSLEVAAGIYHAPFDPSVIAELLTQDGSATVRRAVGTLQDWPTATTSSGTATTGSALTLISPSFAAPRTSRVSIALSQRVRTHTSLHISTTLRRTDFLARRSDLNSPTLALGTDQYGRPLFGALAQQGSLLFARPGSNRRFAEFDVVGALTSDGTSNYWDVTAAAERTVPNRMTLFASYTYSHTSDSWPTDRTGAPDASFDPRLADASAANWSKGVSDFDVPHRVVLGIEQRFGGALHPRVAALYRYRSGGVFTPGFRAGVDANGDSFARNDPAYIDATIAGMDPLLTEWKCLRSQVSHFAARNSCREPGAHSFDLRMTAQLAHVGAAPAELFIDALNILDTQMSEPDGALVLVDASRTLRTVNNETIVPLVANPHFGKPLQRLASGRALRIGMRVNY